MKQTFNLIDTCQYCSTSRAMQSVATCMFTGECRFSKSRGLSANISFLPLPLPQFPVFGSCSFLTIWPENPVPRVFLCSEQKHLLHRLHRRLGVDFSFRWSMFDSWPNYFFSFNFVLYFFNHNFYVLACFPFILIAALLITTSRGVSW